MLLDYLKKNYIECKGGVFVFSQHAYDYDIHRNVCKISTPIYNGSKRLTNMQIAEKLCGEMTLQPCYCDDINSLDVAVISKDSIVGQLNKTVFSSKGLGTHLAPLLCAGDVEIKKIKLSNDDYPYLYFEISFS